jgi:hypothetical protein
VRQGAGQSSDSTGGGGGGGGRELRELISRIVKKRVEPEELFEEIVTLGLAEPSQEALEAVSAALYSRVVGEAKAKRGASAKRFRQMAERLDARQKELAEEEEVVVRLLLD